MGRILETGMSRGRAGPHAPARAPQIHCIVLAGGDGTRARAVTTIVDGVVVPKQFFPLLGGTTPIQAALWRAQRLAPPERLWAVVQARHRRYWRSALAALPAAQIIVEPRKRGTLVGVLLPLVTLLKRAPAARVVMFPSDHAVEREDVLGRSVGLALRALSGAARNRVVLLGMKAERPDPELGWIVPSPGDGAIADVARFVERPDGRQARRLLAQGGLYNSLILVAEARSLLALFEEAQPSLVDRVLRGARAAQRWTLEPLEALYEELESRDLSKHVLAKRSGRLAVMSVPSCGWADLGTPERIRRCFRRWWRNDPERQEHGGEGAVR